MKAFLQYLRIFAFEIPIKTQRRTKKENKKKWLIVESVEDTCQSTFSDAHIVELFLDEGTGQISYLYLSKWDG